MTAPFPALHWHRPLMLLAIVMAALTGASLIGLVIDDRTLTGMPIWTKSVKFAVSVVVYAVTWAWLIAQLTRWRKIAWWAGTIAAAGLAVELIIIVTQIVRGTTSHFNYTTPLNATLWNIMGASIILVWVATLVVSVALFRNGTADRARNTAIRYGAALSLAGAALGLLMVPATPAQRVTGSSVVGAHTVGLPDGGPGLPFLGWSSVGGDLRVPHFIGMHALQALPLLLVALEFGARRIPALRSMQVRHRLIVTAAVAFGALLVVLTWQALRGQSVVRPDGPTLLAFLVIVVASLCSAGIVLRPRAVAVSGDSVDAVR
ncbi:hypothetical protein [Nocardia testacea]|uniref:hypothetical protein n=1 Tax=Nocardia testacea TaxID=248551 RepID=UPI00058494EF|nr:hypothetical protein [Nocardia testacea]